MNTNQHYVSQALLRRYTGIKGRIQRYKIKYEKWDTTAPRSVFSRLGYNQLSAFGTFDDSLDREFKKLEDVLPRTLAALDDAATREITQFDTETYNHLCWYCAFLWHMCPFSKAVAPVNFIQQIMTDAKHGQLHRRKPLLTDMGIAEIQRYYNQGSKFIIRGNNYLQLVYRIQFVETCKLTFAQYRHNTRWTVYNSPIDLPISDIAVVQYHEQKANVMLNILPISPRRVLVGVMPFEIKTSNDTIVKGSTLTENDAEYILDIICASAFFTVASQKRIGDISAYRKRAKEKGVAFVKITNLETILAAGLQPIESETDFLIAPASTEEYVKFTHSFVLPSED